VSNFLRKPILIGGAVGAIVGLALLYVSASAAFGEPENTALAQTLFPYALVADPTLFDSPWIVLSLAFLQYPLYGAILGFGWTRTRHRAMVTIACVALMLGGHFTGVRLAHVARAAWEETQLKWE